MHPIKNIFWKTKRHFPLKSKTTPPPLSFEPYLFAITLNFWLFYALCLVNTIPTMPARKTVRWFLPIYMSRAELATRVNTCICRPGIRTISPPLVSKRKLRSYSLVGTRISSPYARFFFFFIKYTFRFLFVISCYSRSYSFHSHNVKLSRPNHCYFFSFFSPFSFTLRKISFRSSIL